MGGPPGEPHPTVFGHCPASLQPLGPLDHQSKVVGASSFLTLAHRNRNDFCDLRLRCPSRTPEIARFPKQEKAMPHCDLRVRWKVASDLRFRAAISEPKTPSFCGISGDLAQSTQTSLAIAIVRFWCAKFLTNVSQNLGGWVFEPGAQTLCFLAPPIHCSLVFNLLKYGGWR